METVVLKGTYPNYVLCFFVGRKRVFSFYVNPERYYPALKQLYDDLNSDKKQNNIIVMEKLRNGRCKRIQVRKNFVYFEANYKTYDLYANIDSLKIDLKNILSSYIKNVLNGKSENVFHVDFNTFTKINDSQLCKFNSPIILALMTFSTIKFLLTIFIIVFMINDYVKSK